MPETIFVEEVSQYFFDNRMIETGKLMTRKYHSPVKYTASRQLIKKPLMGDESIFFGQ